MKRVITGAALAVAVWGMVFHAPPWIFLLSAVAISAVALREFFAIARAGGAQPFVAAGHAGAVLWLVLPNLDRGYFVTMFAIAILGAAVLARLPLEAVLPAASVTVGGLLYVAGPMLWGILLHGVSPHWLFFVILVVAAGDISALAVGRRFGRRKLAARTSPNKTWEGTIASVIASTGAGAWYAHAFLEAEIALGAAAMLAIVANVAGQIGDLVESAFKRAAGVKDSGGILPGHGGVLDRIDGMLFAIPVGYGYVLLFG